MSKKQTTLGLPAVRLEHKSVSVETKILDEEQGIAEIWVSTTNVVDDGDDLIIPGAYAQTLSKRNPKGVYFHDMTKPVAKTLKIEELAPGDARLPEKVRELGAGSVRVEAQFNLATPRGRDTWADIKFFGEEQEYSIGYYVPPGGARYDEKTGVRHISTLELFEWSPVLFGMAPGTGTTGLKSAHVLTEYETTMEGSLEARKAALLAALAADLADDADTIVSIVGTFEEKVYASVDSPKTGETILEVAYSLTDTGGVELGTKSEVTLASIAVPKPLDTKEATQVSETKDPAVVEAPTPAPQAPAASEQPADGAETPTPTAETPPPAPAKADDAKPDDPAPAADDKPSDPPADPPPAADDDEAILAAARAILAKRGEAETPPPAPAAEEPHPADAPPADPKPAAETPPPAPAAEDKPSDNKPVDPPPAAEGEQPDVEKIDPVQMLADMAEIENFLNERAMADIEDEPAEKE